MLKENEEVVVYFATGRGPIGSSPGLLYLMKDSVVVSMGQALDVGELRRELAIEG